MHRNCLKWSSIAPCGSEVGADHQVVQLVLSLNKTKHLRHNQCIYLDPTVAHSIHTPKVIVKYVKSRQVVIYLSGASSWLPLHQPPQPHAGSHSQTNIKILFCISNFTTTAQTDKNRCRWKTPLWKNIAQEHHCTNVIIQSVTMLSPMKSPHQPTKYEKSSSLRWYGQNSRYPTSQLQFSAQYYDYYLQKAGIHKVELPNCPIQEWWASTWPNVLFP